MKMVIFWKITNKNVHNVQRIVKLVLVSHWINVLNQILDFSFKKVVIHLKNVIMKVVHIVINKINVILVWIIFIEKKLKIKMKKQIKSNVNLVI